MATKTLPYVKNIFTGYALQRRRIPNVLLKRDTHFGNDFLGDEKKVSRALKVLVGTACLTLGGYFVVKQAQKSSKKAEELKLANIKKNHNFMADLVETVADAVVHITVFENTSHQSVTGGSGFIIQSDGLIVTNAHVVGNQYGTEVQVILKNGRTFRGYVTQINEVMDLALISIRGRNLPVLKLGSTKDLRPGEWVAAIGSPCFLSHSVTAGVVSAVHRTAAEIGMPERKMSYIQTDTSIVAGNSGGPLVNLKGEVIGVNAMTIMAGISFAIPVEYVKLLVQVHESVSVAEKGKFYIGLSYFPLGPTILKQLRWIGVILPDFVTYGMYVWKVEPQSPAFLCGIQPGDVLMEADGERIYNLSSLYDKFRKKNTVKVKFYRRGSYYETNLTPKKK